VRTARDLHDEISENLFAIGTQLDTLAGLDGCSVELRTLIRSIRNKVSQLCDLLTGDIPAVDEASRTIFSIEIRRAISEINGLLDNLELVDETLIELRTLLDFPKYFLAESRKSHVLLQPLTKREKEVLLLLPRGITAKAMASELFLTEATIKSHLASIYRKFEVVNRTQAIAIAIENKILAF